MEMLQALLISEEQGNVASAVDQCRIKKCCKAKGQLPNGQIPIFTITILGMRVCLTVGYGQNYEGCVCSLSMLFIWYILYQTHPRGRPDLAIPGMRGTGCSVHLACGALAVAYSCQRFAPFLAVHVKGKARKGRLFHTTAPFRTEQRYHIGVRL